MSDFASESALIIRADANQDIGSGHIMRAIALGGAWRRAGGRSILISSCGDEFAAKAVKGFDVVHRLPGNISTADDLLSSLHIFKSLQAKDKVKRFWITLDGYRFREDYQAAIRSHGYPLLVIDDYAHLPRYHADIILNQNAGAEDFEYNAPDARLLCGTRYVLLREEFYKFREPESEQHNEINVLVTFGGADCANVSLLALKAIHELKHPNLNTRVILGGLNKHTRELENFASQTGNFIEIVNHADNMAGQMNWADIAISAAGTTSWELCYLGIPSLLIQVADNQKLLAENLDKTGAAESLGWYEDLSCDVISNALISLINDEARRKQMSINAKQLVDGRGAKRLFEVMRQLSMHESAEYV